MVRQTVLAKSVHTIRDTTVRDEEAEEEQNLLRAEHTKCNEYLKSTYHKVVAPGLTFETHLRHNRDVFSGCIPSTDREEIFHLNFFS